MGTVCEIRTFATDAAVAAAAILKAVREISRLEQKYSRYRQGNFLHRINLAAGDGGAAEIDDEFASLLNFADSCYRQSDGMFDITSGVLRKAWDFKSGQLPDAAVVEKLLASVGWHHVTYTDKVIRFGLTGMELDFGGIVKEYAVDRAAAICREHGLRHGVVDMGGDIAVIGPNPSGEGWLVGIQHPRFPDRKIATFELTHGALATSGDYERCLELDGKRYSHILSPKTGRPVQGLSSVSAVAEQCIVAGSVCTTAMLKEARGAAWLEDVGLPHVWVDLDGSIGGSDPTKGNGVQSLSAATELSSGP